jgi:hypothetical protein
MEATELAVAVVAAPASAEELKGSSEGTLAPATCNVQPLAMHQVEPSVCKSNISAGRRKNIRMLYGVQRHDKPEDGLQGSVAGYQQLQPNTRDSSEAGLDT